MLSAADAEPSQSLCRADETVDFSCGIGDKIVSLCSTINYQGTEALAYRYGVHGKVEKEYVAKHDNKNRFMGSLEPANPRALVREIWFNEGKIRYLLTVCTGGDCERSSGLAVLDGDKILRNETCSDGEGSDWFSRNLVDFGKDNSGDDILKSKTDLLVTNNSGNPIYKLYKSSHEY
jgi:hypothetical protein